jgi:hypothetical protein
VERDGPPLEALLHRLTETPAAFQAEPRAGKKGTIDVAAVVWDLMRDLGRDPPGDEQLARFRVPASKMREHRNRLRLVLLSCWLLSDPWFPVNKAFAELTYRFLDAGLGVLQLYLDADRLLNDPDRREELVRRTLAELKMRPAGETVAQASDRLQTLDSAERERVLREAAEAEKRAQEIREAMAKAAAQESANRFGE